ncbi:MAG: YbhB/YbcL family Raf kinase inhibitor-like protein [Polyangiaceae bacterium]
MTEPQAPNGAAVSSITVTSAFSEGGSVPIDFTCDGKDAQPAISWSAPPGGTQSLAVIVDDPDAPSGTFTHFLIYGIAANAHQLKGGSDAPAPGALVGKNDFGAVRYNGPCPPKGEEHRYRFQIFALDAAVKLPEAATRSELDTAMNGHVLGHGTLTAYFGH